MDFPSHTLTPTSSARTVSCRSCRFNEYLDVESHWARFCLWRWPSHRISSASPNHTHPNSWLRFGGVLIHVPKTTPDQQPLPNPGACQDLLKKTHRLHPNHKKSHLRVFHPSVRRGNNSTNSWIWSLRASVTSRLSGAKVQSRVLRATQLLETPSLLEMPNQKMSVTLGWFNTVISMNFSKTWGS